MNIQKQQIQEALKSVKVKGDEKSLIENNLVTNIVVFGDEVNIDLTIYNPTLHAKKQVEVDVLKVIHEQVYAKAKIKVRVNVEATKQENSNLIRGEKIQGVENIIAVASGKGGVGKSTAVSYTHLTLPTTPYV